jgi:hypothetical protein
VASGTASNSTLSSRASKIDLKLDGLLELFCILLFHFAMEVEAGRAGIPITLVKGLRLQQFAI